MRILGIDPGATGALALYDNSKSQESGLRWIIEDLTDCKSLRDFIRRHEPDKAIFEHTWHSGFSHGSYELGRASGRVQAVLECCDQPYEVVHPATWKAYFKISKDKSLSLTLARLYVKEPYTERLKRKMDHNRAEAVLLAVYGSCRLL